MAVPQITTHKVSSKRREELNEELKVVNTSIQNLTVRRDGGKNSIGQILPPIEKELALYNQKLAILKITHDEFEPLNPVFKFQTNKLWLADQKLELSAQIANLQRKISDVEKQKTKLAEDLPVLEKRAAELEAKLKR